MINENQSERILIKNFIKKFILRVDLIKTEQLNIPEIAARMSNYFDRLEKRQISGFAVNFTKGSSEVLKQDAFDYVLISEMNSISLTVSEAQNAFWIESNYYKNNTVYKDIINKIVNVINDICGKIESKRIGMRYINEFTCDKPKNIGHIYGKRLTSIVKHMINDSSQSQIIGVEIYNKDGYKLRLQYGIPNKFYPANIKVYDLIMDIDSFIESRLNIQEWEDVIKNLNHAAYEQFVKEINPKYLEELK